MSWSFRIAHRAVPRHFGLTFAPCWTAEGHTVELAPITITGLWGQLTDEQLPEWWTAWGLDFVRRNPQLAWTANP